LKGEYGLGSPFVNLNQVAPIVEEVVDLYNTDRPHLSLALATPSNVYLGNVINVPTISIPVAV
jgi:transposase InsO family protein